MAAGACAKSYRSSKLPLGMDARGATLVVGVVLALVLGVGAAFVYHQVKGTQTASTQPTPSPEASPSEVPSPSPSPEASPSPRPSPSPSPSATTAPSPAPTRAPAAGAAPYPPQLTAGSAYAYSGSGGLFVGAQDSKDLGGQSVCAGINDSTQTFPTGYEGVYLDAVQFPDGNRVSAGCVRSAWARHALGLVQNNGNGIKQGVQVAGPAAR